MIETIDLQKLYILNGKYAFDYIIDWRTVTVLISKSELFKKISDAEERIERLKYIENMRKLLKEQIETWNITWRDSDTDEKLSIEELKEELRWYDEEYENILNN